jgi:hypothetical protein
MAISGGDRLPLRVVTVELEDGGGLSTIVCLSPASSRDTLEGAVQQHALGMGVVLPLIVWQPA